MLVRIISSAVGIVVGVGILIIDQLWLYALAVSVLGSIGVWELIRAVGCGEKQILRWFCVIFSAVIPFVMLFSRMRYSVACYLLFTLTMLVIMLFCNKTVHFEDITMCGSAALLIPASLSCVVFTRYLFADKMAGIMMVVYLLFCAWFGDAGAYFTGTFLGKHKLCPDISPKKTVEGLIGGIITVGVVVAIECLVYNLLLPSIKPMNYATIIIVGMTAAVVGVLGDLSASVIKRRFDKKDFGSFMPGHGGVLDRFDSVIFVAPFIYVVFGCLRVPV